MSNKEKRLEDLFSHWDTTPLRVKTAIRDELYTLEEWRIKTKGDLEGSVSSIGGAYMSDLRDLDGLC